MKVDWKRLYLEMMTMRSAIESLRSDGLEDANKSELRDLLATVRAFNVELIALRSVLEQTLQSGISSGGGARKPPGADL